eukprot:4776045-Alexandrium_andersonii.AAC.1
MPPTNNSEHTHTHIANQTMWDAWFNNNAKWGLKWVAWDLSPASRWPFKAFAEIVYPVVN